MYGKKWNIDMSLKYYPYKDQTDSKYKNYYLDYEDRYFILIPVKFVIYHVRGVSTFFIYQNAAVL